jgi:hypothetical protein
VAAIGEAVLRFHDTPARLTLNVAGALVLMTLAVRRTRPLLALGCIGVQAVVVALATHLAWPGSPVEATVGVLAMMLATYSVGAHASGPVSLAMAVLVPLGVVLATDLTTRRPGQDRCARPHPSDRPCLRDRVDPTGTGTRRPLIRRRRSVKALTASWRLSDNAGRPSTP